MRILYATDGSEGALAGAHFLARLPVACGSSVTLLTVLREGEERDVAAMLAPARAALTGTGAVLDTQVSRGSPAEAIVRVAEDASADLVVVGSRGRSGLTRFLLGSVAERVARHAPCSVLLARPLVHDLRKVILGVDGSECAARAAARLEQFPLPEECTVHLGTVLPPRYTATHDHHVIWPSLQEEYDRLYARDRCTALGWLDALDTAFTLADKRAIATVETGDPAHTLLELAEHGKADLLVVGSHGRSGLERFLLGSVSEKVLRHAPCSVLVMK